MAISNYPQGFPDGLILRGMPIAVSHPGKVFWVGNSATLLPGEKGASDGLGNKGTHLQPYATIDYAVGQCKANRGDIIMVRPNHSEDISSATSLVLDVAGVAVIGLGSGTDRPDLNFSATAGSVEIDAANVSLHNLTLTADVTAVVVGINVDADNALLSGLEMTFNATGDDFITMIDCDGVNGLTIENCTLKAEEGAAGCDEAIRLDDCDHVSIIGNHITGDFTDGAIIGEGAAGVNLLIKDNTIYNADTTAGFLIDLNVAFTGLMINNRMGTLFATAPETAVDPGSLLSCENYVCNAVDESGALVPTTVST
jgi:hypothetical protein